MSALTLDHPLAGLETPYGVVPADTGDCLRLLVTGARDWPAELEAAVRCELMVALQAAHREVRRLIVVHGACPTGADAMAVRWCDQYGVETDPHPADWDHCAPSCPPGHRRSKRPGDVHHPGSLPDYCPKAGPRRNSTMVAKGADRCVAFVLPGSVGTLDCVRKAERAGIPTRRIRPNDTNAGQRVARFTPDAGGVA